MDLLFKIKRFVLFDYGLIDRTCDKSKYIVNKKCGIANSVNHILERLELIHIILSLLKNKTYIM